MKKRILIVFSMLVLVSTLCACGKIYTCGNCGKSTSKAYYNMSATSSYVMCENCAREYWMPLDYNTYRVK